VDIGLYLDEEWGKAERQAGEASGE